MANWSRATRVLRNIDAVRNRKVARRLFFHQDEWDFPLALAVGNVKRVPR